MEQQPSGPFENTDYSGPQVGLAFAPYVGRLIRECPELVDYIEVPFEQLEHNQSTFLILKDSPVVLHCSSLSIGGTVDPAPDTVSAIQRWAIETRTPWIGEHLAFILADAPRETRGFAHPFNVGFTVSPQMSPEMVKISVDRAKRFKALFQVPLILENSPIYFTMPGTTLSQVDFLREVSVQADTGLLLDLTHLYLSALNVGFDVFGALDQLPLERVVEIHISGVAYQSGIYWDNHAQLAPPEVFSLLRRALIRARPLAITLEYNWFPTLPSSTLAEQIARVRQITT